MFSLGRPRVRLDRNATRALRLPGVGDAVEQVARDVAREAESIARSEAFDEGDYAGNFRVVTGTDGDRATAAIYNDDPAALFVEFGARGVQGKAVLRRAGERAAGAQRGVKRGGRL